MILFVIIFQLFAILITMFIFIFTFLFLLLDTETEINTDIDKYHEAERYNRAQARRKEKNLIIEREDDDIIIKNKKDGRIYPLRWNKEPIEKRHPISFYKIKKEDDDNGKA